MKRLSFCFVVLWIVQSAQAWVPDLSFCAQEAAQKNASLKTYRTRYKVTAGNQSYQETLFFDRSSELFRIQVLGENGKELFVIRKPMSELGVLAKWMFDTSSARILRNTLGASDMQPDDVKKIPARLDRARGIVAWVYTLPKGGEMWLLKDAFAPFQYLFEKNGGSYEALLEDFSQKKTGYGFARTLSIYRSGELVVRGTLIDSGFDADVGLIKTSKPLRTEVSAPPEEGSALGLWLKIFR